MKSKSIVVFLFLCLLVISFLGFVSASCTDSDGGINKYQKGRTVSSSMTNDDQCLGQYLLEYSCENDSIKKTEIECNCVDGVCWDSSICIDSENPSSVPKWYQNKSLKGTIHITYKNNAGGIKEQTIIDECNDNYNLVDYSCSSKDDKGSFFFIGFGNYIRCENGCKDGACVQSNNTQTCTDSDGGINYAVKGKFSGMYKGEQVSNYDSCVGSLSDTGDSVSSSKYIGEGYCENGELKVIRAECPNGCKDGACIQDYNKCWSDEGCVKSCMCVAGEICRCSESKCVNGECQLPANRCTTDKNCPPINCIKAPCPINRCVDGTCNAVYNTCSAPVCSYGTQRDTGQKDNNGCVIYTCYPGYYLESDKKNYGENDVIYLKISGGVGNVDISIGAPGLDSVVIIKNVYVAKETTVKINMPDYRNVFHETGDYMIATSASNENVIGGVNTNSIMVHVDITSDFTVKEQDQCGFKNSKTEQKCYTAEQSSRTACSGTDKCIADISGYKGEKITWKSTCGGYGYTVVDGINEYIEFDCSGGEITPIDVKNKGFRYAYWQCYDGYEEKQGSESSCKPSEVWQEYAKKACDNHCSKDSKKCGVNSFSLSGECYIDEGLPTPKCTDNYNVDYCCKKWAEENNVFTPSCVGGWNIENDKCYFSCKDIKPPIEPVVTCKDSCPLDEKCYPFGYRKTGEYCSDKGSFEKQSQSNNKCENNFECSSNVCVSGKCISENLIQKILNWFNRMFGGKR